MINLLKVKPGKQDALIALLKQNTDTVVRTLLRLEGDPADHRGKRRRRRRHRAEWETSAAVEAMRSDPPA